MLENLDTPTLNMVFVKFQLNANVTKDYTGRNLKALVTNPIDTTLSIDSIQIPTSSIGKLQFKIISQRNESWSHTLENMV